MEDSRKQQYDRENNGSAGNRKVKRNERYEPAAEYNKPSDVGPDSLHLTQHINKYMILHLTAAVVSLSPQSQCGITKLSNEECTRTLCEDSVFITNSVLHAQLKATDNRGGADEGRRGEERRGEVR